MSTQMDQDVLHLKFQKQAAKPTFIQGQTNSTGGVPYGLNIQTPQKMAAWSFGIQQNDQNMKQIGKGLVPSQQQNGEWLNSPSLTISNRQQLQSQMNLEPFSIEPMVFESLYTGQEIAPKQVMLMFDDHTFDDEMMDPNMLKGLAHTRSNNNLTAELLQQRVEPLNPQQDVLAPYKQQSQARRKQEIVNLVLGGHHHSQEALMQDGYAARDINRSYSPVYLGDQDHFSDSLNERQAISTLPKKKSKVRPTTGKSPGSQHSSGSTKVKEARFKQFRAAQAGSFSTNQSRKADGDLKLFSLSLGKGQRLRSGGENYNATSAFQVPGSASTTAKNYQSSSNASSQVPAKKQTFSNKKKKQYSPTNKSLKLNAQEIQSAPQRFFKNDPNKSYKLKQSPLMYSNDIIGKEKRLKNLKAYERQSQHTSEPEDNNNYSQHMAPFASPHSTMEKNNFSGHKQSRAKALAQTQKHTFQKPSPSLDYYMQSLTSLNGKKSQNSQNIYLAEPMLVTNQRNNTNLTNFDSYVNSMNSPPGSNSNEQLIHQQLIANTSQGVQQLRALARSRSYKKQVGHKTAQQKASAAAQIYDYDSTSMASSGDNGVKQHMMQNKRNTQFSNLVSPKTKQSRHFKNVTMTQEDLQLFQQFQQFKQQIGSPQPRRGTHDVNKKRRAGGLMLEY